MKQTFSNLSSLVTAMQKELHAAMQEVNDKGYLAAVKNTNDYYSIGNPKQYKRTYSYEHSPKSTGVIGSGDRLESEIYLDMGFKYSTGSWSTPTVFEAIELGFGGVLGKTGRWEQTEADVEKIVSEAFGKRFDQG